MECNAMNVMRIEVSLAAQRLRLLDAAGNELRRYSVSTGAKGAGEQRGSYRTPRGRHVVRAKIGAGAPLNTVFVARRPNGEIYGPALEAERPGRDWILTRILWLSGTEPGLFRYASYNSSTYGALPPNRYELPSYCCIILAHLSSRFANLGRVNLTFRDTA